VPKHHRLPASASTVLKATGRRWEYGEIRPLTEFKTFKSITRKFVKRVPNLGHISSRWSSEETSNFLNYYFMYTVNEK